MNGSTIEDINRIFGDAGNEDTFDEFPTGQIRTDSNPLEPAEAEVERVARSRIDQEASGRTGRNGKDQPTEPKTTRCDHLLTAYLDRLRSGEADTLYRLGDTLDGMEVGSGLITTLAAPPGAGKTALASQIMFEALANDDSLIVTIANAEMHFDTIARRELSRRSGVRQRDIRFGNLTSYDWEKLDAAQREIDPLLRRCRWLEPPHTFNQLETLLNAEPGFLILDYLQKFALANVEARLGVNAVMGLLRLLALKGWGILALSATTRTRGKGGSSHDSTQLNLASLKESGECEFNSDSVYLLRDIGPIQKKQWLRHVWLACVKNRHDDTPTVELEFRKPKMEFVKYEQAVDEHDFGQSNAEPFRDDEGRF